ncbi:MAG: hypothetical protein NTV08_15370 [Verrucomicrobia bacterium]|nr:hypothetical protein [Verrucomicrobiota bacterium]
MALLMLVFPMLSWLCFFVSAGWAFHFAGAVATVASLAPRPQPVPVAQDDFALPFALGAFDGSLVIAAFAFGHIVVVLWLVFEISHPRSRTLGEAAEERLWNKNHAKPVRDGRQQSHGS